MLLNTGVLLVVLVVPPPHPENMANIVTALANRRVRI
jgi:hypothetical protein